MEIINNIRKSFREPFYFGCWYLFILIIIGGIVSEGGFNSLATGKYWIDNYISLLLSFLYVCTYSYFQYSLVTSSYSISKNYGRFAIAYSISVFLFIFLLLSSRDNEITVGLLKELHPTSMTMYVAMIISPFFIIFYEVIQRIIVYIIGYSVRDKIVDKSKVPRVPLRVLFVLIGGGAMILIFYIFGMFFAMKTNVDVFNLYTKKITLSCKTLKDGSNEEPTTFPLKIQIIKIPYNDESSKISSSSERFALDLNVINDKKSVGHWSTVDSDDSKVTAKEIYESSKWKSVTNISFDRITKILEFDSTSYKEPENIVSQSESHRAECKLVDPI